MLDGQDRELDQLGASNDVRRRGAGGARRRGAGRLPGHRREGAAEEQLSYRTTAPEQTLYARMAAASTLGKMRSTEGRRVLERCSTSRSRWHGRSTPGPWCSSAAAGALPGAAALGLDGSVGGAAVRRSVRWGCWAMSANRQRIDKLSADEPKLTASDCKQLPDATCRCRRWPATG